MLKAILHCEYLRLTGLVSSRRNKLSKSCFPVFLFVKTLNNNMFDPTRNLWPEKCANKMSKYSVVNNKKKN